MSGGGGGGDAPKVKVSEGEKIQAQLAKDQIDYYRSTYVPLEREFVKEANRDFSSRMGAEAGSAAMRELGAGLQATVGSAAPVDVPALSGAVTQSRAAGWSEGRRQRDDSRLDALKVGLGMTADASRSLSQAASIQTESAIDRTRQQIELQGMKDNTKNAYLGALGSTVGAYGTYKGLDHLARKQEVQDNAARSARRQTAALSQGTAYEHPAFRAQAMSQFGGR